VHEHNSTPWALRQISVPILITAVGGHYFIADNEIHEVAASKDKEFLGDRRCCARSNAMRRLLKRDRPVLFQCDDRSLDYVAKWANARFK
jgi:hypothetical protein